MNRPDRDAIEARTDAAIAIPWERSDTIDVFTVHARQHLLEHIAHIRELKANGVRQVVEARRAPSRPRSFRNKPAWALIHGLDRLRLFWSARLVGLQFPVKRGADVR